MAENRDRNANPESGVDRDKYRDNDDMRAPLASDQRNDVKGDTKSEARGDARESVGRHAGGTDFNKLPPEENDKTKGRPSADEFDRDLQDRG
jgi:hypothetical protein